MIRRLFSACLLRPADVPSSREDFEVIGVFNPGAVRTEKGIVLLVRIAERPKERREGYVAFPRWDNTAKEVVVDWVSYDELVMHEQRVVKRKKDGLTRLTFVSHLRVVYSRDGRTIDSIAGACIDPASEYEEFGVEDPRITRIDDVYYITYVAVSRHGAATALASTKDFRSFERHGIILPPENKDVVLFPNKIGGAYVALHRPNAATPFCKPEMWIATSPDLIHWGRHEQFLGGSEAWEIGRVGAGTPPVRTPEGWLEIFHGNSRREQDLGIGSYSGAALLLDLEDPRQILGRSRPLLMPENEYERDGFVPDVVFPTGIVEDGKTLLIYYGAADTSVAVAEFSLKDILNSISRGPATGSRP